MSAAILLPSTHRNPSLWVRFPAGKAAALVSQVSEKRFRPFEQIQPKRYALGFAAFAHVRTPLCVHNNPLKQKLHDTVLRPTKKRAEARFF
ncbi:hypothetical protein [Xanthomonas campestris]|uniref:hypothetical protein n=1 Tax=Xanthomonas campestris TaxID=339 RepID=UPI00388FF64A